MSELFEFQEGLEKQEIRDYKNFSPQTYQRLTSLAKKIKSLKIIHINTTPHGGGVAELLKSQIPLENSLGLKSHWLTIKAPESFFIVTKKIHNLLQGNAGFLTEQEQSIYLNVNRELGKELQKILKSLKTGIVVIHDPQLLPVVGFIPKNFVSILRLHLDILTPNQTILEFLKRFMEQYKLIIVTNKEYIASLPWIAKSKIKVVQPAIDPLSEKNRPIDLNISHRILEEFSINWSQSILTQVSRFDQWKDPMGVIKTYYLAKKEIPHIQLIMAGLFLAQDDPEAFEIFKKIKKHDDGDPDIYCFAWIKEIKNFSNDLLINALYTASDVIIQKSIREGFGLTITEAMWKGKPVVAGRTSGTLLQIKDGKNGFLVSSSEEAAKIIVRVIKDKKLNERIGKAARSSVKQKFLFPRYLLDNLKLYYRI